MQRFKKYLTKLISSVVILSIIQGCSMFTKLYTKSLNIDLSNMDEVTLYKAATSGIQVLNEELYTSTGKGIYKIKDGALLPILKGEVWNIQSYQQWIYFLDSTTNLSRIDTQSHYVEFILKGISSYIICPAGLFWVENTKETGQLIKHANSDGSNVTILYKAEYGAGTIGDLLIYHHSLYFLRAIPESIKMGISHYRIDLETGNIEKPDELQMWKVDEIRTKFSEFNYDHQPVKMWLFDIPENFIGVENGWLYFVPFRLWIDPVELYKEIYGNIPILYKIQEDGTKRSECFSMNSSKVSIFSINDGWIYYKNYEEDLKFYIFRKNLKSKEIQKVTKEICNYAYIIKDDLYYSLCLDDGGTTMPDNLFRISIDNIGKSEQLY